MDFYKGGAHPCAYLEGQTAESVYFDPNASPSTDEYELLLTNGFRRSGKHLYRPDCPSCIACVPTRVSVAEFSPNRSQRRNQKANAELSVNVVAGQRTDENYDLWQRYLKARHGDGEMANTSHAAFDDFLLADWAETLFIELRHGADLVGVAVTDVIPNGLSAVYTFFEPNLSSETTLSGLGVNGVLRQVEVAAWRELKWLYLGYWISECQKMSYKVGYQPIQGFQNNEWSYIPKS